MEKIVVSLADSGRVTIPAAVRQALGLKPYDKIAFVIDDGQVQLMPVRFTLETAYQSVPPLKQPLSDQQMSSIAKEDLVERFAHKLS